MFKIKDGHKTEFRNIMNNHRFYINRLNMYNNSRILMGGNFKHIDDETYCKCFRNGLSDIELVSNPIDIMIPGNVDDNKKPVGVDTEDGHFFINTDVPEAKEIVKRLTRTVVCNSLDPSKELTLDVINKKIPLEEIVDDIMVHFFVYKFLDEIDVIRLHMFSNLSPMIEYVVDNVSINDIKNHITSKKINIDKYSKQCADVVFNPELAMITQYFKSDKPSEYGIKPFDPSLLLKMMASNLTITSDIDIIVAIYESIAFAMIEIYDSEKSNDSKCILYTKELSEYMNSI